jgi:hypothetical protein
MANIINRSYYDAAEKGRQDKQQYQRNALGMQAVEQDMAQTNILNERHNQEQQAEKVKQFAEQATMAARYASQAPAGQTKQFIEKNFPFLVETYGPEWATATDDQVRAELQGIQAKFGVQAGIWPAEPKGHGALYKYVGPDGNPVYGDAPTASGQTPYVEPRKVSTRPVAPSKQTAPTAAPPPSVPPPAKPRPPSVDEKKAAVMFGSMVGAEGQLATLTGSDTSSIGDAILGSNPITRPMQGDDFRKHEAAGLRWSANLLYLKSGATAGADEIRSTWRQFFPQMGDSDGVKAQKAQARNQEMLTIANVYNLDASKIPQPASANSGGWSIQPVN